MKKLLYQFDTDEHPSVFDSVVCHDGGADHVIGYGGVHPHNVGAMVDGAIFTRSPKEKKNTAIFIGPVVSYHRQNWWAAFSAMSQVYGANFTGNPDNTHRLELEGHERLNLRLLVGFSF